MPYDFEAERLDKNLEGNLKHKILYQITVPAMVLVYASPNAQISHAKVKEKEFFLTHAGKYSLGSKFFQVTESE